MDKTIPFSKEKLDEIGELRKTGIKEEANIEPVPFRVRKSTGTQFEEDFKGSIEVGKAADFTVFSTDIMTVDEMEILETHNNAFSDYAVEMNWTLPQFQSINKQRGVRYDLSIGAFDGDKLVDMFEHVKLGLKPVKAYEVDFQFFEKFDLKLDEKPT